MKQIFYPLMFGVLNGMALAAADPAGKVEFNKHIRAIYSDRCFHCHGPDAGSRKAGLRFDLREEALKERDGVRAIVPGKPEESEAVLRVFSEDPDEIMPPPKANLPPLSVREKELFREWIRQGAQYQPHWAFVAPPDSVPLPEIENRNWARGDLDRFVLARLEAEKLEPAPEAPRERWLRRATFDLTGLPPKQVEIDDFLADGSAAAYEKVADRLLASQGFGERMAVPWLDLARYADSFGYQADGDTQAWPYRDWVIRALNANLPWDQFITWQIAGDLLPNPTRDQRLATAFSRIHRKTNEGGSVPEEFRQDGISDRVHTFGTAFLGLTLECARCHDHKFDPISQRNYYAIGAFFNSIEEFGLLQGGGNRGRTPQPALLLPTATQEQELAKGRARFEKLEQELGELPRQHEAEFQAWLAHAPTSPAEKQPDLAAHFELEAAAEGKLVNSVDDRPTGKSSAGQLVPGRLGKAIGLNGDDPITLPDAGVQHCHDPVSFALWVQPGEAYPRAVVLANTSSFDKNYNGFELLLEEGRLRWTWMKEFPGSAISVRTTAAMPVGQWSHVAVSYDGSSRADGLKIYLNGQPAPTETVRDHLTGDIRIGKALEFGARGRDFGLRGGALDDIFVFKRAITPLEVALLCDGKTLTEFRANTQRTDKDVALLREYYFSAVDPSSRKTRADLLTARTSWSKALEEVAEIPVMEESATPRPAFVLSRGAYDAPAERVERTTPAALPPFPKDAPRNRLGLARWLTAPNHPLTARVLINRLWQEFFRRGLVVTAEDFGLQGAVPSHPELLDWLARDFIAHGWDHKRACRQIVLSATYRQDSRASKALRARDPDNILLARGPAKRLSAEELRDGALALGGLLDSQVGGPPVKPYAPEAAMWKSLNNFLPEYKRDTGAALWRRSLYTFWRRTTTPPNMMVFDTTSRDVCAARRQQTNTPLQPLVLLNDPQYVEAGRALGERMLREGGASPEERIAWAFREVTGRAPTKGEIPELQALYAGQRELFAQRPQDATELLKVGEHRPDKTFSEIELAAAATTANALLNLDASIVLR